MSAATDIVKNALASIGAHSETLNPADPGVLKTGFNKLVDLIEELLADEIYFGRRVTLTSSGVTVTGTLEAHGLDAGDVIYIAGATQAGYNGRVTVTAVPTPDTFQYAMAASQDSPATAANAASGITMLLIPDEDGDDILESRAATSALEQILAPRLAPLCRIAVPQDVRDNAGSAAHGIRARFQAATIPNLVPARGLPLGQGGSRGVLPQTFMGGAALDDDSSA